MSELEAAFRAVIDEYLQDCSTTGKTPDKPFSGRIDLRISPELHRTLAIHAARLNVSLNVLVEKALREASLSSES